MCRVEASQYRKSVILTFFILSMITIGCINTQKEAPVTPKTTPLTTGEKTITEIIRGNLIGTNITYYDFAGRPVNYTIKETDVKDIQETTFKGGRAWKVKIGETLSWNVYIDEKGEKIIDVEQLFKT